MKQFIKDLFQEIRFASQISRMADGNRASRRKAKRLLSKHHQSK